jgi:osmotically-inducible protein OsmY
VRFVLVVAGIFSTLGIGCARGDRTPDVADTDLRRSVEQALASDAWLSMGAKNVAVSASDGIVTFSGSVATETDHQQVRAAVDRLPGVVGVADHLSVSAARDADDVESDRTIVEAIHQTLASDTELAANSSSPGVQIVSRHGLVRLDGAVQDERQRERVEEIATATAGVAAVENDLDSLQ